MDDINLFDKNEKELKTLRQAVMIYSQGIGIEFGMEKCATLIMRSGKRRMTEGIKLPNQEKIRMPGKKKTCKYLEILEADTIEQVEMKEKKKSVSEERENYLKPNYIAITLI